MKIEISGLYKSFGSLKVFDDLNLTINQGEIVVILGRSGTGKSVMLKHLTGLMQPDAGKIVVDGTDIVGMKEKQLYPIRMRFGMIFQNGGMLQSLNVAENVALPLLEVRGADRNEVMKKVSEKLEMVGLSGKEEQSVSTLSGGQQKRVAIARALLQEAECILLDEPTAGLDPPISQTVDDIIIEVNKATKATMVLVTHDLVSAFQVGNRIVLLDKGKVALDGKAEDFHRSEIPAVKEFLARGYAIQA